MTQTIFAWQFFIGIAFFCYLFDFAIGTPLSAFNPRAILAFIPKFLCRKRMQGSELAIGIWKSANESALMTESKHRKRLIHAEAEAELFSHYIQQYVGFEKFLLCPVCLHFWLSAFSLLFFIECNFQTFFASLLSHFLIRKITK